MDLWTKEKESFHSHLWDDKKKEEFESILKNLKANKIKKLDLCDNNIGNEGCKYLSEVLKTNISLQQLYLQKNFIGIEGCKYVSEALKVNKTLLILDISHNLIADEGCKYISDVLKLNTSLKALGLGSNSIGKEGHRYLCETLKSNNSLPILSIENNALGVEGCKYLSEMLKINHTLFKISFGSNNIGNEGCKYLCEVLKANNTLRKFYLENNNIGNEGYKYLNEALKTNYSLHKLQLFESNMIDNEAFLYEINTKLAENKSKCLSIFNNRSINFEEIKEKQTTLKVLRIRNCTIKYIPLPLENFQTLEILDLTNNELTNGFIKSLSQYLKFNPSLKQLILQGNKNINDEGGNELFVSLSFNVHLIGIDLIGTSISAPIQENIQSLIRSNNSVQSVIENLPSKFLNFINEETISEISKLNIQQIKQKIFTIACLTNRIELCKFLLNEGSININFQSINDGNTFLHYSCMKNNYAISKLLIEKGVNIHLKNNNGLFAKDLSFGTCSTLFANSKKRKIEENESINKGKVNENSKRVKLLSQEDNMDLSEEDNNSSSFNRMDLDIESLMKKLSDFRNTSNKEHNTFILQFVPENLKEAINQLEIWLNNKGKLEVLMLLRLKLNFLLKIETNLNKIQEEIRTLNSKEELTTKHNLLTDRNNLRKEFVDKMTEFNEWISKNICFEKIKEELKKLILVLEILFDDGRRAPKNSINRDKILEKTKQTLSKWKEWKSNSENYNKFMQEKIESKTRAISHELSKLLAFFKQENNNNELKCNLGNKLLNLEQHFQNTQLDQEFEKLKNELPIEEIKNNIFDIYEFYKLNLQELEDFSTAIHNLNNRMKNEREWIGVIKPEEELQRFNELNKAWEELNDKINNSEHEIKKLKRKGRAQEFLEIKEKELKEVKSKFKLLREEKEFLIHKLSNLCSQFFPELKIEYPELTLGIYFDSDRLERSRKVSDYEEVEILQIEGGSRNKIYKAKWNDEICILKCFELHDQNSLKSFKIETKTLNKLNHPNICKIECYFFQQDNETGVNKAFIQIPFYEGGQLDNWIGMNKPNENQIRNMLREILKGIEYLHDNGIIHCDIKPQNILMTKDGIPKISDFDISKDLEGKKQNILTTAKSISIEGTMNYMAPEVFQQKGVYKESDIYSLGLIMFDIYFPNVNRPMVNVLIHEKKQLEIPNHENKELIELLNNFLTLNPKERFSAKQALRHPFFIEMWEFNLDFIESSFGWENKGKYSKLFHLSNHVYVLNTNNLSLSDNFVSSALEYKRLEELFYKQMEGTCNFTLSHIYAIQNKYLEQQFSSKINQLQSKIDETWKSDNVSNIKTLKEWVIHKLNSFIDRFHYNKNSLLKIIPAFHAIKKEETSKKILENGFSVLNFEENGLFGKGIYFTSNLEHAIKHFGEPTANGEYIVLVSFIILGKVYPVIENSNDSTQSLKGKPCKIGYDSQFTLVKADNCLPFLLTDNFDSFKYYTEFVIFQENQTLPKYLLYIKSK